MSKTIQPGAWFAGVPDGDIELAKVALGEDAKVFLNSPLGRYLFDRAEVEIERLRDELESADPEDRASQYRIRNKIKACRLAGEWINEAIMSAAAAEAAIIADEAIDDDE